MTACLAWNEWARARALAELRTNAERAGAADCEAERLEVGYLPWHRFIRAKGVRFRLSGPLDKLWDDFNRVDWPAEFDVEAAQVTYEARQLGTFVLAGVRHERVPGGQRILARELNVGSMTWRDVSFVITRPKTVVELRLGSEPTDPRALGLSFVPSPGQGIEWTLSVPSQPFREFAERAGFRVDESWNGATTTGTGSLVLPEAKGIASRAHLRFVVDEWHRPNWPEAALLTGASGAIALSFGPAAPNEPWLARAEVEAGLFSLEGTGKLGLGDRPRLAFQASGERTCAELAELLPPSSYRQRVRDHLQKHRNSQPASNESVRLSLHGTLTLSREAPPLRFRWHLGAGCGASELAEP